MECTDFLPFRLDGLILRVEIGLSSFPPLCAGHWPPVCYPLFKRPVDPTSMIHDPFSPKEPEDSHFPDLPPQSSKKCHPVIPARSLADGSPQSASKHLGLCIPSLRLPTWDKTHNPMYPKNKYTHPACLQSLPLWDKLGLHAYSCCHLHNCTPTIQKLLLSLGYRGHHRQN